jgi:protein transport protein SEC61 subunit alpha
MNGEIEQIGILKCFLLIFQLVAAGILVIILDEVLSQGYGLGSGISLFIATNKYSRKYCMESIFTFCSNF